MANIVSMDKEKDKEKHEAKYIEYGSMYDDLDLNEDGNYLNEDDEHPLQYSIDYKKYYDKEKKKFKVEESEETAYINQIIMDRVVRPQTPEMLYEILDCIFDIESAEMEEDWEEPEEYLFLNHQTGEWYKWIGEDWEGDEEFFRNLDTDKLQNDPLWYDSLMFYYCMSELNTKNMQYWDYVLGYLNRTPEVKEELDETIKIWRGGSRDGYSWTTNKSCAKWFLENGYNDDVKDKGLWELIVDKKDVCFYTNRRQEEEVVLYAIHDIKDVTSKASRIPESKIKDIEPFKKWSDILDEWQEV